MLQPRARPEAANSGSQKHYYKPEVEQADNCLPADVLAGDPAGKPDSNLPKKKRRTTHSVGARRRGRARDEPGNGEIKKRRYAKRGDGTRRHGRPPDLTLGGPFGHSESWNMGVYPGRGPALISCADMIILPPTTPSAITFEDSATLSAGISGHSDAEDTVTDTFLFTLAVDSTPGLFTPTAMRDETPMEPPAPHAPRLI